jgi:hypothetical protein
MTELLGAYLNKIVFQRRYEKVVLEEEGLWGDHEIDVRMSYRGMQPNCSAF